MAAPVRRVPVEERLFSLVLALLASAHGLTKAEILSTVTGYAARYDAGGDRVALERQFERDKEDLREIGVPLETVDERGAEGDTKLQRYRIDPARYQLPDDVRFDERELALLVLAARVWRDGSLSSDSRRAVRKLQSLGVRVDEGVIGFAPTIRTRDAAHEPLAAAIDRGQQVRFDYVKPGTPHAAPRTVSPLALVFHEGRWHLHAHDDSVDAPRTFLLRRIVGGVELTGQPATRKAAHDESARVLAELEQLWTERVGVVRVRQGSEAEVVLRNRAGTEVLDVENDAVPADTRRLLLHATDLDILADELAAFGGDAVVESPDVLRGAVRTRWQRVVSIHG